MPSSLTPIEKEMQLPDAPKDKCLNHPTVKAVRLHLCVSCLEKWEKAKVDYEAWDIGVRAENSDKEMTDNEM
jgi:hypothetical protein